MPRTPAAACLAIVVLLAACGEKPDQRLAQDEVTAAARDQRAVEDERRQRQMGQGESDRIYNQGGLR